MDTNANHVDQIVTGVRRILSSPHIYDGLQSLLGVDRARKFICEDIVAAKANDLLLDVGCGTAELLQYLPIETRYFGFDLSPAYIQAAVARYAKRKNCSFTCSDLADVTSDGLPLCTHAIAYGVLHHLNDVVARNVLSNIFERLSPGGRVVTVDPVIVDGQAFIARQLIRRDRGQHVRTPAGYTALVPPLYEATTVTVRHNLLRVPYSLAIMVMKKGAEAE